MSKKGEDPASGIPAQSGYAMGKPLMSGDDVHKAEVDVLDPREIEENA